VRVNARFNLLPSPRNPLVHALSLVLGAIVLVGAALLGAFVLAIALSIGLIAAVVVIVRVWWLQHKMEGAMRTGWPPTEGGAPGQSAAAGRVIDVEYTVVESDVDDSAPPR
jgi:hypothetical protein